jgi:predicted nucleic acid-binding protein
MNRVDDVKMNCYRTEVDLNVFRARVEETMEQKNSVRDAISELVENLGTVGVFMLGEARALLRRSWGASRQEFMAAVDQAAKTMKQSGKMAAEDVERAAEKVKQSWELLQKEKNLEWDSFFNDLTTRLKTIGSVTQETFELCVNQARDLLDKQWEATGRLGEDQLKLFQEQSEKMAKAVKGQWGVFRDVMEKTGKKIDRAVEAAWEELKKKD